MTTRIYGPPVEVPLPSGHSLGLTASGLNGGFGAVPYVAALAPTAACTWLFRAKSIDPSGYNGVGATLMSQWDTAGGLGRLICYRNTVDDTQLVLGHSNTGGDVVSCTVYTNTGVWTENVEQVYDAMQEKIWACAQCYTCAARCPTYPSGSSPNGTTARRRSGSFS